MKEHKSDLQQKVIALDHSLNQARYELSERAVEVRIKTADLPAAGVTRRYVPASAYFK